MMKQKKENKTTTTNNNTDAVPFYRYRWSDRLSKTDTLDHMDRLLAYGWTKYRIAKALTVSRQAVIGWSDTEGPCAPNSLALLPDEPKDFKPKEAKDETTP